MCDIFFIFCLDIPTKSSIIDFSLIENSTLFLNVTLKEVYPAPICYILFFSVRLL